MKISRKFDKRYNLNEYKFIRNYTTPNKVESVWKHKTANKALIVNWNSKSSYYID